METVSDRVCLRSFSHWRTEYPFCGFDVPLEKLIEVKASLIGNQIRRILDTLDDEPSPTAFMICSTVMSPLILRNTEVARKFHQVLYSSCALRPIAIVDAYECASWGHILRFFLQQTQFQRIVLTIVDIDVHNYSYWKEHPHWGKAGFGATCLVLDLAQGLLPAAIILGYAPRSTALIDFCRESRAVSSRDPSAILSVPFFTMETRALIERHFRGNAITPDYYNHFGHCFGSDTWIGVAKSAMKSKENACWLVASLALNGYYAIAPLSIDSQTKIEFSEIGLEYE